MVRSGRRRPAEDKAAELIKLAKEGADEFFRDQYQTGYVVLNALAATLSRHYDTKDTTFITDGHEKTPRIDSKTTVVSVVSVEVVKKTLPLNSHSFKLWLARSYYEMTGSAVGRDNINSAILVLEAEAQIKPMRYLYNRFAPNGELSYWWDMGDERGWAVHISKDGWIIESSPPKLFRRYPHMLPIYEPRKGGDLTPFLKYLNLEESGDKLLAIISVISYLIPEIPRVGTVVTGMQGSGKSTWHRLIQTLLDPASTDLLTLPTKDDDLIQVLEHHAVALFDNVNQLTRTQSDILCRAITGTGNEKRELYTTDDSFIRQFMRIVGLNGVSMPIEKSDLFSRVILLPWEPITDRKTDAEMRAEMRADAPMLLGAMLDVLVEAVRVFPDTRSSLNVRMSDFARWGCAITVALGLRKEVFERAYRENIKSQDEESVRASMVAEMIIRYMRITGETQVEGSATDIKKIMESFENPPDDRGKPTGDLLSRREGWPKNSTRFGRELTEVAPALMAMGYKVATPKKGRGKSRNYTVEKIILSGAPEVERGQRSFDAVNPDELTDERLRLVLVQTGEKFKQKSLELRGQLLTMQVEEPKPVQVEPVAKESVGIGFAREALLKQFKGEPMRNDDALAFLGRLGLSTTRSVMLIASMMRDGTIFCARPGHYQLSSSGERIA